MIQERLRGALAVSFRHRLASEFSKVADQLATADASQREAIITGHEARLEFILRAEYNSIFRTFGARALGMVRKSADWGAREHKDELDDKYGAAVKKFIRKWSSQRGSDISKTTNKKLDKILARGAADGLSEQEIARSIRDGIGGALGNSRAMTIARTETHSASQDAAFEAIQETGLNVVKEWISVEDDRTRPDHVDANGQVRDMDKPFDIGEEGDELLYPGDPSGPANQVVNCRCVCVYVPVAG